MFNFWGIQFLVSFTYVFLKGFQHQNVIGGKYLAAFILSWLMAAFEVIAITLVVKSGWIAVIPIGAGASLGIVSSMLLYRKLESRSWDNETADPIGNVLETTEKEK